MLTVKPKILIADELTRGVDVGAKSEIHSLLRALATEGTGVIVVSSELNEILGICDRVIVMYEGKIVGEVKGEDVVANNVMHYASGAFLLEENN
jgi:ribose transport system ATP-binding protein